MSTVVLVVVVVLVVAGLVATVGVVLRRGREDVAAPRTGPSPVGPSAAGPSSSAGRAVPFGPAGPEGPDGTRRDLRAVGPVPAGPRAGAGGGVLPRDLAAAPGGLTLLQLSSEFCTSCRASRAVLTDVASETPGVGVRDVDVAVRPELVRLLDIRRTPTTLVVDARGGELWRTVGVPRRADLAAALRPHLPGPTSTDDPSGLRRSG